MLTNALNTVGQYGMAGLGALGNVVDLPGSAARDLLAGKGLAGSFDQFATPFSDGNRTSGRELLRHYGMAGDDDNWGNFAGGMAVEAATDPLNLIGGGWLKQAAKARATAMNANRGIDAANATSMAQRAAGFMPEEIIPKLHPSVLGPDRMPKTFYHGTPHAFDRFDTNKMDQHALFGRGIYNTDAAPVANGYADTKAGLYESPSLKVTPEEFRRVLTQSYNAAPDEKLMELAAQGDGTLKTASEARQYLLDGIPHDDAGIALEAPVLQSLGIDTSGLINNGGWIPAAQNVRRHYLDVRKPFDVEGQHIPSEAMLPGANELMLAESRRKARIALGQAKFRKDLMAGYSRDAVEALDAGDIPDSIQRLRGLARTQPQLRANIEALRDAFRSRNTPSTMSGRDAWTQLMGDGGVAEDANSALRKSGYDSILHTGGSITGTDPHNVAIAFDPSQVHLPYIAPALQQLQNVPRHATRTAAALAGHNALRTLRRRDER